MEFIESKNLLVYYNEKENEFYIIEFVEKSGDDDTIFMEVDTDFYLIMNRKVLNQLDNLLFLGEL